MTFPLILSLAVIVMQSQRNSSSFILLFFAVRHKCHETNVRCKSSTKLKVYIIPSILLSCTSVTNKCQIKSYQKARLTALQRDIFIQTHFLPRYRALVIIPSATENRRSRPDESSVHWPNFKRLRPKNDRIETKNRADAPVNFSCGFRPRCVVRRKCGITPWQRTRY